jgi:hypothetical protein
LNCFGSCRNALGRLETEQPRALLGIEPVLKEENVHFRMARKDPSQFGPTVAPESGDTDGHSF